VAKKTDSSSAPVVTSLPLPSSDSVLVIDLPDGQKLLVGKMAAGSVIEVATWRGTGRPDSRTNRLMLGMSNGEVEGTPEGGTETAQAVNKLSAQYALYLLRNIVPLAALGFQKIIAKVKSFKKGDAAITSVRAQESSEEVQEWLNKITQSINQNKGELIKSTPKSQKGASKPKKSASGQKSKSNVSRKG
jgi:hypothetical protein